MNFVESESLQTGFFLKVSYRRVWETDPFKEKLVENYSVYRHFSEADLENVKKEHIQEVANILLHKIKADVPLDRQTEYRCKLILFNGDEVEWNKDGSWSPPNSDFNYVGYYPISFKLKESEVVGSFVEKVSDAFEKVLTTAKEDYGV